MNISITFRHMEPSEAVKSYTHDKLAKVQKFLRQPMNGAVTLGLEKLEHVVELRVSSGAEHFHCKEQSPDMYASIDKAVDVLERQIRTAKGAQVAHRRGGPKAGEFVAQAALAEADPED